MSIIAHRQSPPGPQDIATARYSSQVLSRYAQRNASLDLRVTDTDESEQIKLPASAVTLLMKVLKAMAEGRGLTIIPENAELTTVQAAEILNVSRPFLIKLLDQEQIPHRMVGKHRRIRMEDVMSYKSAVDRDREAILDQLVAEAQEQDMGYTKP